MASLTYDAESKNYQPMVDLINSKMEEDQGNRYRYELEQIILAQKDIYQQKQIQFRSHMGASLLGGQCKRSIWYSFRWVKEPFFDGRMIRLFNRGHMEEMRLIALLRQAGLTVWFTKDDGGQFEFSNCRGHYGGSLDCVVRGVPGFDSHPMLGEFKTHSEKSFNKLVKLGVALAKPEHKVQMNQYMGHYRLKLALYVAVNKNNDELYIEIVEFDQELFDYEVQVATNVALNKRPPPRMSKSESHFVCKYCDFKDICFNKGNVKPTCRTCENVVQLDGGNWECNLNKGINLSKEMQYNGCSKRIQLEEI